MSRFDLVATSSFGIESIVADELRRLGYQKLNVESGRISFRADYPDIAKCNIWLRCAERVYLQVKQFSATDFGQLFEMTKAIDWADIIPENGMMHITAKSVKSQLYSLSDIQSIVKKAIIESMKRKYPKIRFAEDGAKFHIEASVLRDQVSLLLDTSGAGLHKRGYRQEQGLAPIKETLAAAIVYLSRWTDERIFADPCCGSGTLVIEAAMQARNIAPGLKRNFAAEAWPQFDRQIWQHERAQAKQAIKGTRGRAAIDGVEGMAIDASPLQIFASDIDKRVFDKARANARMAGVEQDILFQRKPLSEFRSSKKFGVIACNPPYGSRLGEIREAEALYRQLSDIWKKLDSWSLFVMAGHDKFEQCFGQKASKNRKLYNGNIKTYLYQYFGPLPRR